MKKHLLVTALAVMSGIGSLATAATWYVSPSGNDTTGDGSNGNPWATFSHALAEPSVVDNDNIFTTGGTVADSFTITKEVGISGSILVNGLNSVNGYGIEIQADNVSFNSSTIFTDTVACAGGTIIYGNDPNDGLLTGISFFFTDFWAAESENEFPAPTSSGIQLLELHSIAVSGIQLCSFKMSAPNIGNPSALPDNGVVIYGNTLFGGDTTTISENIFQPIDTSSGQFKAGTGLSLQPGQGPSAGIMMDGMVVDTNNASFGLTAGFEIKDTASGANEGITNVQMYQNVAYFNDYGFKIHGLANDGGTGITDVFITNNQDTYNTTNNDIAGIYITQDGTGTSNIDFSSVKANGNAIFNNGDMTSFAILNDIPSTIFNAKYNYFGSATLEVDTMTSNGNRISSGVDITPGFIGPSGDNIGYTDIDFAGGIGFLGSTTFPQSTALKIEMNAGQIGEFGIATQFYPSGYPDGLTGIIGGNWAAEVIQIETDVPDGEYVMIIKHRYSESALTNAGIDEEDFVLYFYNESANRWQPAVNGNTQGTPSWEGNSIAPNSATTADLGRHGVETANNIAWAVVDHTTDYGGGEGLNGMGDTNNVSDWNLY